MGEKRVLTSGCVWEYLEFLSNTQITSQDSNFLFHLQVQIHNNYRSWSTVIRTCPMSAPCPSIFFAKIFKIWLSLWHAISKHNRFGAITPDTMRACSSSTLRHGYYLYLSTLRCRVKTAQRELTQHGSKQMAPLEQGKQQTRAPCPCLTLDNSI